MGLVVGAAIGFVVGFTLSISGVDIEVIKSISRVLGFMVGLPISYVCFRWSITRFILPQTVVKDQDFDTYHPEEAPAPGISADMEEGGDGNFNGRL